MVYLPTGSSDLIPDPRLHDLNFLFLSYSILCSSSLWRTDTIDVSKLNKPPRSPPHPQPNGLEINKADKPPSGLNTGLTVFIAEPQDEFLCFYSLSLGAK